jgi:DNA-binding SARP family transcriptional activator
LLPTTTRASGGQACLCLVGGARIASGAGWTELSAGDAALLALLALRGPQPRHWLASLLWPGSSAEGARNSLRQRVFKLRTDADTPVLAGSPLLGLAPGVTHDLGDPLPALRADPSALAGALLGELSFPEQPELAAVIDGERAAWRRRVHAAIAQLVHEFDAQDRIAEALAHAGRLVQDEPLREHSVRLLMRLHQRRGDRAAALLTFEEFKDRLFQELGDRPSDETAELAAAIARRRVADAPPAASPPAALRLAPALVGRTQERAEAQRFWDDAGWVLLAGPAGIGKTRLLDDLRQRWAIDALCALRPDDMHADLALLRRAVALLWPVLPAGSTLRQDPLARWLAGDPGAAVPPGTMSSTRLAAGLGAMLAEAHRQGLAAWAVEDLHFADTTSLDALCHVLQSQDAGQLPRCLLSSRDQPLPAALAQRLALLPPARQPVVELRPLSEPAIRALLEEMALPELQPGLWALELQRHTGGHPLSLLQVLRALSDSGLLACPSPPPEMPVPRAAMQRIARALDRGEPQAQQLAFVAALAGVDFDVDLAATVLECKPLALLVPWRQLEAMDVLQGRVFSHELVRQAVLEAVPLPMAAVLHRAIARALPARPGVPFRRAQHWQAASDWGDAAAALSQAADESAAAGLVGAARDRFKQAAELFARAGDADNAFEARWRACTTGRAGASTQELLADGRALRAVAANTRQQVRALCVCADALNELQDEEALALARQAVAEAADLDDATLRATARIHLANALQRTHDVPAALAEYERAMARPEDLLAADRHAATLVYARLLCSTGRRRDAVDGLAQRMAEAEAAGRWFEAADYANAAAVQAGLLDRLDDSLAWSRQSSAWSLRAGYEPSQILVDDMNLASVHQDLAQFSEAIDMAQRALDGFKASGQLAWRLNCENMLASIYGILGRFDLATRLLALAPPEAPAWAAAFRLGARARMKALQGSEAETEFEQSAAALRDAGVELRPELQWQLQLERLRWSPDATLALASAGEALAWADGSDHLPLQRLARMIGLDATTRLGRAGEAAERADELLALSSWPAEDRGLYGTYRPDLWWLLCQAWDAAGRAGQATKLARQAAAWIHQRAGEQVPADCRQGFLHRNRSNQGLLARAITPE